MASMLVVFSIIRAQMSFYLFIKASQRLHDRMLRSVLRAKIEFFDTNPLGRILNRFSADVGIIDETLPLTIYDFLVGAFMFLGGISTAIVALPFILLAVPPLIWCFLRLRSIFVSTTRELKRLEGLARSPIFAMISESLNGIATVRANNKICYFKSKFEAVHDAHSRAHFAFMASSRWFATSLDFLAFLLMSTASILSVLFNDQGWFQVDPATLGLALTMLLQIAGTNFPWMVRQSAEVTNQMVSVERVLAFGSLPPEAALTTDFDRDCQNWPQETSIYVDNLTARYRSNLPTCVSGVSLQIESGQRVGVVGRFVAGGWWCLHYSI
jgi:ATP-binding cassette subfamily C (CFTR/MRP) protein 4